MGYVTNGSFEVFQKMFLCCLWAELTTAIWKIFSHVEQPNWCYVLHHFNTPSISSLVGMKKR